MIFYNFKLNAHQNLLTLEPSANSMCESPIEYDILVGKIHTKLNQFLDKEFSKYSIVMQAYDLQDNFVSVACCYDDGVTPKTIKAKLLNAFKKFGLQNTTVYTMQEITSEKFKENMRTAEINCNYEKRGNRRDCSWTDEFDTSYLNDHCYYLREVVFNKMTSKKQILKEAESIAADQSLLDELNRIFSSQNKKGFYGIPVHYKITAGSIHGAFKIVELLVSALNYSKRLLGARTNFLTPKARFHRPDEDALTSLFEKSKGIATAIVLQGSSDDESDMEIAESRTWDALSEFASIHHHKNLMIFVEIVGETSNTNKLLAKFVDTLDIIEIHEGFGSVAKIESYLSQLMKESEYKEFADEQEVKQLLESATTLNISTAFNLFEHWKRNVLKTKVYPSYQPLTRAFLQNTTEAKSNPYMEELENLVGLAPVKKVVKQILASFKLQRVRSQLGLEAENFSKHMIFTGNPGAAKTTVARLLAKLLATEGILETGNLVECGRSDLVGKYVGWTAKTVKEKFNAASGGVLFIDEAYALADKSGSFGDEAINTIVQEMENHRDDVIVIFAGYPDKMQAFLDKNEGLRSRIAFHINFPDYNPQELGEILQLMANSKGYCLKDDVAPKCQTIFQSVYRHPEFGNGRFVRNMLEQAIMQQALRIADEYQDKPLTKETICHLQACDFDEDIALPFQKRSLKRVGFAA